MIKKLTDRFLWTLKPPATGRLVIVDTDVRGLTFRMTVSGVRSFSARYRPRQQGQQRSFTIGTYPEVTLAQARQRARDILAAAKKGVDLIAEEKRAAEEGKRAAATARTVSQLAFEFIENFAKINHRRWRDTEQRIANHILPRIGDRAVSEIRRADVVELLDEIERVKGLGAQVSRTRTTLSSMFAFAIEREIVASNPVAGVRRRKDAERTRTLNDAELKAIWQALDELPDPGRAFVRALLLSACRRDEIRHMQWREIDLKAGLWTLPAARNKSGRDHEIPMSRQMIDLLTQLPRVGPFVFTINGNKPWTAHDKLKPLLDLESGVFGWTYHDLRRTVRSNLAAMGVSFEIAERILGHAITKIERTYNRHAYKEEKARALQAWADRLSIIVGDGRAAGNVVPMERAKG